MIESLHRFADIFRHGYVHLAADVIPVDGKSNIFEPLQSSSIS